MRFQNIKEIKLQDRERIIHCKGRKPEFSINTIGVKKKTDGIK